MNRCDVAPSSHYDVKATGVAVLMALILPLAGPGTAHAGKLEETRSAARDSGEGKGSDESSGNDSSGDDSDSDLALACLIPFVMPFCLIGMRDEGGTVKAEELYFLSYPYAGDHPGHLLLKRPRLRPPPSEEDLIISDYTESAYVPLSRITGRLTGEYYYDLDTVHVPGIAVLFDSASRIGFETRWRLFLEPLDETVDKLTMGHFNLNFRLLQRPSAEAHLGLGGRLLIDNKVTGGVNTTLRLTLFPVRPMLSSMEMSVGNLGRAFFLEGQATVGAVLGRAEFHAGYRGTLIYGRSNQVVFHGPTAGITAWF